MDSLAHRQNILHPSFREIGTGTAGDFHTAVFGARYGVLPIFINNGAKITASRNVTLTLPFPAGVGKLWISDSPTFANVISETITITNTTLQDERLGPIVFPTPLYRSWILPPGSGERSVYIRYAPLNGQPSLSRATIRLVPAQPGNMLDMPPLPPATKYFQSADGIGAATFDHGLQLPDGLAAPTLTLHHNSFVVDEERNRSSGLLGSGNSLAEYAVLRRPDTTPSDSSDDSFVLLWDGVLWPLVYADPTKGGDGSYRLEREQDGAAGLEGQQPRLRLLSGAAHGYSQGAFWELRDIHGMIWRFGTTTDSAWRFVDPAGSQQIYRWNLSQVEDSFSNYQTWQYQTEQASLNGVTYERSGWLTEIAWNGHTSLNQAPDRRLRFVVVERSSTDYDSNTERFYRTKRLDQVIAEVGSQTLWRYQFGYDTPQDGTRSRLTLRSISKYAADQTTLLERVDLDYASPQTAGEGFHLDRVSMNGTLRWTYAYGRYAFNGMQRYRLSGIIWATSVAGPDPSARTRMGLEMLPAAPQGDGSGSISISYGNPIQAPDEHDLGGFASKHTTDGNGNSYEQKFHDQGGFEGQLYKQFCTTAGAGSGQSTSMAPVRRAAQATAQMCHEYAENQQRTSLLSGVTLLSAPVSFEDIRQPDGSYQHLQTTTIRDAHGSVVFEDQYGEQGTVADDRYIERVYGDPAHPRLPTREELRDTTGRFLSRTTMRYAAQGQLLEQGRWLLETNQVVTTTSTYDARGLLLSETTPTGATTQYGYDKAGHRTVMTDTLGVVTHYSYDAQGRLLSSTDARGAQTSYQYDPITGLLQSSTNALGGITSYQYDARKRKVAETNALGQTTRYGYNSLDQLVVMTDTLGLETRYEYTAQGQRAATRNPLGQRSSMRYNAATGWLVESRGPLGQVTRMDYDGQGRLVATMAPNGARTAQRYDAFGRVTVTLDPLGQRTTTQYDAQDRVLASTDALSNTTRYAYDSLGRMTVMTDTLGYATHYTYDADGRMTSSTDVRGATTSYRYDAAGRQIAVTNALSQTTRFGYDALGNQTVVTDTLGYTTRTTYDLLGRRVTTTDALGQTTQYGYDALGNQTVMTDTLGSVTRSVYDAAQRRIAVTNALSETTRFGYDAVGNTTVITDALGHATHFVYDAANRRIATSDLLSRQSRTGYDALGHTVALTDTAGITSTMTYDLAGRVTGMTNGLGITTQQQYDAVGRLIRRIRPDGVVTRYDYDVAGRLVQVVEHERLNQPADAQTNVVTQFSYDASGNLLTITDARGHTQTFAYDLLGRQIRASDPLSQTQQLVYTARGELDYTIDPMGRTTDYTYDALGRLTRTDYPDGTPDVTLQYNAASQVITMTDGLSQTIYGYDALGRMRSRDLGFRVLGLGSRLKEDSAPSGT